MTTVAVLAGCGERELHYEITDPSGEETVDEIFDSLDQNARREFRKHRAEAARQIEEGLSLELESATGSPDSRER